MTAEEAGFLRLESGRRAFLKTMAAAAGGLLLPASLVIPAQAKTTAGTGESTRRISLVSLNNGDKFDGAYWADGRYLPQALKKLNALMRDSHNGQVCKIDPKLFDQLWRLQKSLDTDEAFEVVCGFRSRKTNAMARRRSREVAKQSLHMSGRAVDLRLEGTSIGSIAEAARSMEAGGVGYYPHSGFVHIDTGAVRTW
jgi:uncharacterized protein YcbK (DUF882 family)